MVEFPVDSDVPERDRAYFKIALEELERLRLLRSQVSMTRDRTQSHIVRDSLTAAIENVEEALAFIEIRRDELSARINARGNVQ